MVYISGEGLQRDGKGLIVDGVVRYSDPTTYFDAYFI